MTAASSRSRRAKFTIATTVTLLPALAILAIRASPVSAQEESYTLNVSTQGNGKVTAEGIDCGNGGSDCSETYPVSYQRVCEPNPDLPPAQFCANRTTASTPPPTATARPAFPGRAITRFGTKL